MPTRYDATLIDVPRIFFRAVLRLIARTVFAVAGLVLLLGGALALFAILIATWRTPRTNRVQIVVDFFLATVALVKELRQES